MKTLKELNEKMKWYEDKISEYRDLIGNLSDTIKNYKVSMLLLEEKKRDLKTFDITKIYRRKNGACEGSRYCVVKLGGVLRFYNITSNYMFKNQVRCVTIDDSHKMISYDDFHTITTNNANLFEEI